MKKWLLVGVFLTGCFDIKDGNVRYWKDMRTGLCFAYSSTVVANNFSFTNVPCDSIPQALFK